MERLGCFTEGGDVKLVRLSLSSDCMEANSMSFWTGSWQIGRKRGGML